MGHLPPFVALGHMVCPGARVGGKFSTTYQNRNRRSATYRKILEWIGDGHCGSSVRTENFHTEPRTAAVIGPG